MNACEFCGAPLERSFDAAAHCEFCGRKNNPLPREVAVPVEVKVVQVVAGSGAPSDERELRCPHCRRRLVSVVAKGVELSGCGACGGIWIDNANARRVLATPDEVFSDLSRRAGRGASGRRTTTTSPSCPVCTGVMDRAVTHEIELDVCPDHGTWFDAFELTALVDVLSGRRPATASFHPGDERRVVCVSCNNPISATRANVTDAGLMCEPCWRTQQARALASSDREQQVRGAVTVGGVLLGVAAVMLGAAAGSRSS